MLQTEDWITQWCLENALFKEWPEKNILNLPAEEFCGSCYCPSQKEYFETVFFEETFHKTNILMYPLIVEFEVCVRKCIWDNCIKQWKVRRIDCIAEPNICFSGRNHFNFTELAEAKFRFRIPLYHRRNGWYRSVGRRKTVSGIWLLQVVDTSEGMINVAFIDNFNDRKAARAVRNRYAEHFCSKTWSHGSG